MAENFANEYQSTLSAAITSTSATSISVTSATGAPATNFRIRIDDEYMLVTGVSGTTLTVTRGVEGSTAATHTNGSPVTHVLTAGGLAQYVSENGGSGGFLHSYAGYNTIGGTAEGVTGWRQFVQKITLASDKFCASVDIYCKQNNAGNGYGIAGFIYDDVSGKPVHLLAVGGDLNQPLNLYRVSGTAGDARWLTVPLGIWLPAGDYWYGGEVTTQAVCNFYYDATGTSYYWDKGGNGFYTDAPDTSGTVYTLTSQSRTYSFRLNLLG